MQLERPVASFDGEPTPSRGWTDDVTEHRIASAGGADRRTGSEHPEARDEYSLISVPASDEVAKLLIAEYLEAVDEALPGGFDPSRSVQIAEDELPSPTGDFLVALDGTGTPVGCGALRQEREGVYEIKRMWVRPAARGRGLGRLLLEGLEARAAELGAAEVVLDTSEHLQAALGLYRGAGYVEIAAYNENPYASHWFRKRLGRESSELTLSVVHPRPCFTP